MAGRGFTRYDRGRTRVQLGFYRRSARFGGCFGPVRADPSKDYRSDYSTAILVPRWPVLDRCSMRLSMTARIPFRDAITVIDGSPDIASIEGRIRGKLRLAVDRQHSDALYERLEGWWLSKVIQQLRSASAMPVAGFEVYDKVRSIAQPFGPEGLPIDYLDARPESLDAAGDTRMFVRQLRAIDVGIARIEKAMVDFYRAFEQRSRWAREELLIGDEVELYESRLVDEWERFSMALAEELSPTASETEQRRVGRQVFNWMEQTADVRIP